MAQDKTTDQQRQDAEIETSLRSTDPGAKSSTTGPVVTPLADSKIASLEVDVDDHKERIAALEDKTAASSSNIVSMDSRIEALEAKPDASETVAALDRRFNALLAQLSVKVHGVFVPDIVDAE